MYVCMGFGGLMYLHEARARKHGGLESHGKGKARRMDGRR